LFVPYAGSLAGWLFAASALGMMVGDVIVGRVLSSAARLRNVTGLRVLLAVPFLLFFLQPPIALAAGLAAVAAVGYAATLAQQEQLVTLTPPELHGQTLGVESSMRMTMQGACALLAGALADSIGPSAAITVLAAASLVISVVLTPQLARTARQATACHQTT
jgi:predicted MFS family arabinose efflux permease